MKNNKIIKFIITGIINTVFYFILYSIFIFMGLDYKMAVFIATVIGVFFSFKMFGKFVFNNEDKSVLNKFILLYIVLYLFNIFFVGFFENIFNNYYTSGLIATALCAIISFVLNKLYVFKK